MTKYVYVVLNGYCDKCSPVPGETGVLGVYSEEKEANRVIRSAKADQAQSGHPAHLFSVHREVLR